jgi:hypothetical protein
MCFGRTRNGHGASLRREGGQKKKNKKIKKIIQLNLIIVKRVGRTNHGLKYI